MTDELAKKLADLERRVEELERRPVYYPQPVVVPVPPYWTQPYMPMTPPWVVTCEVKSDTNTQWTPTSQTHG